jgi:hypothetical protein
MEVICEGKFKIVGILGKVLVMKIFLEILRPRSERDDGLLMFLQGARREFVSREKKRRSA